jgi:hypothetical protein
MAIIDFDDLSTDDKAPSVLKPRKENKTQRRQIWFNEALRLL